MRAFILCGSREWKDPYPIGGLLDTMNVVADVMIHGDAPGADSLGAQAAADMSLSAIAMPAQWERDGKAAGPARNVAMLGVLLALRECGYEVSVEAFSLPQSVGTKHMKRIAAAAGVTVNEHGRTA